MDDHAEIGTGPHHLAVPESVRIQMTGIGQVLLRPQPQTLRV